MIIQIGLSNASVSHTHTHSSKLHHNAAAVQIPIGLEQGHEGVVDIIRNKAYYFEGDLGTEVVERDVPADLQDLVAEKQRELFEVVANVDETLGEQFLSDVEPSLDELVAAIRRSVIRRTFTPVFMGSALKNKGVQPLLDGVLDYLPNPSEVTNYAIDNNREGEKVVMSPLRDESQVSEFPSTTGEASFNWYGHNSFPGQFLGLRTRL